MEIKSSSNSQIDDVELCVAITYNGGFHVGFFFKDHEDRVMFLHLAWFEELTYEIPTENDKYLWLDISIGDEESVAHFNLFLERIVKKNAKKIPYGISIDNITFNKDGSLSKEDEFSGLTCATFVLRALHAQGYNVIDLENWKINEVTRVEDAKWQENIINYLTRVVSKDYVEHQRTYIGKVARFRPTEIAVAAHSEEEKWPLTQEEILELSVQLSEIVIKHMDSLRTV